MTDVASPYVGGTTHGTHPAAITIIQRNTILFHARKLYYRSCSNTTGPRPAALTRKAHTPGPNSGCWASAGPKEANPIFSTQARAREPATQNFLRCAQELVSMGKLNRYGMVSVSDAHGSICVCVREGVCGGCMAHTHVHVRASIPHSEGCATSSAD